MNPFSKPYVRPDSGHQRRSVTLPGLWTGEPWEVSLFGGLSAVREAHRVTHFKTQKVDALFAYIALHPDREHLRGHLIALSWPDVDEGTGRARLSDALTSIRTTLSGPDLPNEAVLIADRRSVRLNPQVFTTDVAEFERAVRRSELTQPVGEACETLEAAVALYTGELLPGCYEDWVGEERQRLETLYHRTLGRLADLLEESGDLRAALGHAQKHAVADPYSEGAHRAVIRLHLALGDHPAAVRQFTRLEQRLREWGGQPSPDTLRLLKHSRPQPPPYLPDRSAPGPSPAEPLYGLDVAVHVPSPPHSEAVPREGELGSGEELRLLTFLCVGEKVSEEEPERPPAEGEIDRANELLRRAAEIVERYGGQIEQVLGGKALAVFGKARAHEDDPERAVHAAREIRAAAAELGVTVAAGIEAGEAYVAPPLSPGLPQVSVSSPAIRRAERLHLRAETGEILVGETAYRTVRRSLVLGHGLSLHSGPSSPAAYSVDLALTRSQGGSLGEAELTGRETEFAALKDRLDLLRTGVGGLAVITGEAGIGKTRLVSELKEVPCPTGTSPLWLEGRAHEWEGTTGYALFQDLFRSHFMLDPGEAGDARADTVRAAVRGEAVGGDRLSGERADEIAALLSGLLSPAPVRSAPREEGSPERARNRIFSAVGDYLAMLAGAQPLVLVFEDLHWADPLSLGLVLYLAERLRDSPVLTLCLYRELPALPCSRVADLGRQKQPDRFLQVQLDRLSPEEGCKLLASLLSSEALPPAADAIISRTDGVPLFLEEVVRSLLQRGVIIRGEAGMEFEATLGASDLPEAVQIVIQSRLDVVSSSNRELLRMASVIGRMFHTDVLIGMIERDDLGFRPVPEGDFARRLFELDRLGFMSLERSYPVEEYGFRHALTQEAVYHGMPRRRRIRLHLLAAEALEAAYEGRTAEQSEALARHYSEGESWQKAVEYHILSAQKAREIYANASAVSHYQSALACLARLAESGEDVTVRELILREELGDVLYLHGDHRGAEAEYTRLLDLFPQSPSAEGRSLARLHCKKADACYWQGRTAESLGVARKGWAALGDTPPPSEEAALLLEVMCRASRAGYDYESARRYIDQAITVLRFLPNPQNCQKVYYEAAWIDIRQENFTGAEHWLRTFEAVCLQSGDAEGLARCYHGFGDLCRNRGDLRAAVGWFQQSLGYCQKVGHGQLLLEGHLERAHLLILLAEDPETVNGHIRMGLDLAAQMTATAPVEHLLLLCQWVQEGFVTVGDVRSAMEFFDASLGYGPPTVDDLSGLEKLCQRRGYHDWFRDFCRRSQAVNGPGDMGLRYWHGERARPGTALPLAVRETFGADGLGDAWSWHDPDGANAYRLLPEGSGIEVRVPCDRSYRTDPPNAPRLTRIMTGDFAVEAALALTGDGDRQAGGLIVWVDERNFVLFGKRSVLSGELRVEARLDGRYQTVGRGLFSGAEVCLRFERKGQVLKALYRSEGEAWFAAAETLLPESDTVEAGLYGTCPDHWEASSACFPELRLYRAAPC